MIGIGLVYVQEQSPECTISFTASDSGIVSVYEEIIGSTVKVSTSADSGMVNIQEDTLGHTVTVSSLTDDTALISIQETDLGQSVKVTSSPVEDFVGLVQIHLTPDRRAAYRCDNVLVDSGIQTITFLEAFDATDDYTIPALAGIASNGDIIWFVPDENSFTRFGFEVEFDVPVRLTYLATIKT